MSLLDPATSDYFRAGWGRWLLPDSVFLYMAVVAAANEGVVGDLSQAPIGSTTSQLIESLGGLESKALEGPDAADPDETPWRTIIDRAGARYGIEIQTRRDLLGLMRRVGVVSVEEINGEMAWRPVSPVPLPSERLDLTNEERAHEDRIRWGDLHKETAQDIIRIFDPDADRTTGCTTFQFTLSSLGDRLGKPVESVREGLLSLLEEGDFNTAADLERLDVDEPFDLAVDWRAFAENRISIVAGSPPED